MSSFPQAEAAGKTFQLFLPNPSVRLPGRCHVTPCKTVFQHICQQRALAAGVLLCLLQCSCVFGMELFTQSCDLSSLLRGPAVSRQLCVFFQARTASRVAGARLSATPNSVPATWRSESATLTSA